MCATLGSEKNRFTADAASSTDDECDPAAQFFFRGLATNLGLFELPVLDAKCFAWRQRYIILVHGELPRRGGGAGLRNLRAVDTCT
jgi:hypothetical protein